MVKFKQPAHGKVDLTPGLRKSDKLRLILMAAGAVIVGIAAVYALSISNKYRAQEGGDLPEESIGVQEVAFRPNVDRAKVDALVEDATGADRAMLEPEAVEELMRSARQMTASSYSDPSIGARELDAAVSAEVAARATELRGEPFYARGWIERLEERRAPGSNEERLLGQLILEDGSSVYFVVQNKPEDLVFGDFARVNGLFLKMFSDEDPTEPGTWVDGPLLVGRELKQSFESYGEVAELDPRAVGVVVDDDVERGITGLSFDTLWYLMAYARDLDETSIDWDSVPEITQAGLQDLLNDGESYRFQPVRLPISSLQAISIKRATENPARLDAYTEGWIGNTTWKNVMKFLAPRSFEGLRKDDLVRARGIFYKNLAYEPRDGGLHVAPVLIITDMEFYERPTSDAIRAMGYIIGGSALALLVFISFLLTRDRRSTESLQRRLTDRRRARRHGATA